MEELTGKILALKKADRSKPATSNFSWNLTKANKPSVSNNGENQNQLDLINGIALENKEREKKKKNLIIFGANESNDIENNNNSEKDGEQVKNIFTIIDIDFEKVKTIMRFNKSKRGSNPATILVELKDAKDRYNILKKARKLKEHSEYNKVFINPDLTLSQRDLGKKLRDERNMRNLENKDKTYTFVIRSDKVIKIRNQEKREEVSADNAIMDQFLM